jgi:TPR repeat protein
MMHARVLSLLIACAALSCGTQGALAQAAAQTYPWCGTNGGGESCYYATLEHCMATTAGGRGGRCVASPYYRGDAGVAPRSERTAQRAVGARIADRAVARPVRTARAAVVSSVPEPRSARSSGIAPSSTSDQLLAQDYAAIVNSAEHGDATAQYNLAIMYDTGRGVLQDYVLAHKWYNLAASRYATWEADIGASAARSRDRLTTRMTPAQIAEAQKMAREWEPKQGR